MNLQMVGNLNFYRNRGRTSRLSSLVTASISGGGSVGTNVGLIQQEYVRRASAPA